MKMLIKSNKGCSNIHPLQNIIQDEGLEEIVCINPLCQAFSNALEISQNTKQLISFFSREFRML
jgi:hypothetical protein